jgi:hypothetical protein
MWCFFDESYPTEGGVTSVIACLMRNETVRILDEILYAAKRRHYGQVHAKDLSREIKGSALLSNYSFKMLANKQKYSRNIEIAKDILRACAELPPDHTIQVFGAAIYGGKDVLKRVHSGRLGFPIVEMLRRISVAAAEMEPTRSVNLVFDESLTDTNVAISVTRFVAGVSLQNVSQFPLIGLSHVTPGIQLADLGAYILGRRAVGDDRFSVWLTRLRNMEWTGQIGGHQRMGIQRWDSDGTATVRVRKKWE